MDANERRERASEEAALWWQVLQGGETSRAEREQYVDWLRESAVHVAEMLRIARVHGALGQFEGWSRIEADRAGDGASVVEFPVDMVSLEEVRQARGRGSSTRNRRWMRIFALAASFCVLAVAAGWLLPSWSGGQVIETVRGERREVALSDGSVLQVDPETRLTVRLDEDRRRILLERGRAVFRVAKDPERPFMVEADGTIVRAVGTAFGVERGSRGVMVTVAEGKVAVGAGMPSATKAADESAMRTPGRSADEVGILLSAGEQLIVGAGSAQVVHQVDSAKELAWAEGRLIFENDPLVEVIRDFNRYNLVQMYVADETLATRTVSGVFDASDPESFIAFIQTVADVAVVRGKGQVITIESQ